MEKFTKYEIARIIGARALQISMGAPLLIKRPKDIYNTVTIAKEELRAGVLPINIKRPQPVKIEED
ncbi:MAG: DNA-directed RNA polymerase subunit K [DPANN group archaeon]|nr:DNA-directed RNA polymerase subunit K [DPANN group archaeon]